MREHRVVFDPAWEDTERPRGSGSWRGIRSVTIRFYVIGPEGAVQFVIGTGWDLPEVSARLHPGYQYDFQRPCRPPSAWDLGYHRRTPRWTGQEPMSSECDILGGACYYDGSGLNAEPVLDALIRGGSDAVWPILESYYDETILPETEDL